MFSLVCVINKLYTVKKKIKIKFLFINNLLQLPHIYKFNIDGIVSDILITCINILIFIHNISTCNFLNEY